MILIGENINITATVTGQAMRDRNPEPIQAMAREEVKAGIDRLDVNIGPARKNGEDFMTWVVETVQAAADKPLSLDTTNAAAMEAGLKVHKGKALMNSVSLPRMEEELPLVSKYDADMIGLLWGRDGMPRDADERAMIASELMMAASAMDIPNERIWFDPVVTPASNVDTNQVKPCLEFMSMLQEIAPGAKSVVGLSNVSNGSPNELRPYLNRTYLMMLMKYGLHAAIVDAYDSELIRIARGEKQDLVNTIHRMMDGEKVDTSSLEAEDMKYIKTVRVLTGEILYSHSWLEV